MSTKGFRGGKEEEEVEEAIVILKEIANTRKEMILKGRVRFELEEVGD